MMCRDEKQQVQLLERFQRGGWIARRWCRNIRREPAAPTKDESYHSLPYSSLFASPAVALVE